MVLYSRIVSTALAEADKVHEAKLVQHRASMEIDTQARLQAAAAAATELEQEAVAAAAEATAAAVAHAVDDAESAAYDARLAVEAEWSARHARDLRVRVQLIGHL